MNRIWLFLLSIWAIFLAHQSEASLFSVRDSSDLKNKTEKDSIREYASDSVEVRARRASSFRQISEVEGFGIYAGRKSELITPELIDLNPATGNARQLYSKVAGLNVWENDPGGLQLGIGGRGLSPSRVSNFNTRQNGYDISADALGYPESYYIPPVQFIDRIAIVRGAAALQYGTQFGGFIGYSTKAAPKDDILQVRGEQTFGTYGLMSTSLSLGGSSGNWSYTAKMLYKEGEGWRENTEFNSRNFMVGIGYDFSEETHLQLEYTVLDYLARQAGGLTDAMFESDPRQSVRERNWFDVDWHIIAATLEFPVSEMGKIETKSFGLFAQRQALGYLGKIDRVEPEGARDLLVGEFNNYGNETRYLQNYVLGEGENASLSTFLIGWRLYYGDTRQAQGAGDAGTGPVFGFESPEQPSDSDYIFPSQNIALFTENIFRIGESFAITPGLRFEYINTESEGYYFERNYDLAGDLIFEEKRQDDKALDRAFLLAGLGMSYYLSSNLEIYGNISQNYRAINFNDLRVVNPYFRIDPELRDESGFSIDFGFRGTPTDYVRLDIGLFNINYNDKIGFDLVTDTVLFNLYRFRTNIADARTFGIESFTELELGELVGWKQVSLPIFLNLSLIDSRYYANDRLEFDGNQLENAPEIILRTGSSFKWEGISLSYQFSYTSEQFTDATNARVSPQAVSGIIPSYWVMDIDIKYDFGDWAVAAGSTNLTNNIYFTRRASGYPGPGIIPAEPRNFYVSLSGTY